MRNSIRRRLITIFIILAIGPLVLVGALLSWRQYQLEQRQALALQRELALRVATQVEASIQELTGELQLLTAMTEASILDDRQFERVLGQLMADYDAIENLYLLDNQGQEKIHLSRTAVNDADVSAHRHDDWPTMDEFLIPITTNTTHYSSLHFEKNVGQPLISINIPLQDFQTGEVGGVLSADMRVGNIWKIIADVDVEAGESVYIIDRFDNRLIAHENPSLVLREMYFSVPIEQDGLHEGLDEKPVLLASAPVTMGRQTWDVVAEKSLAEAMAPSLRTMSLTAVLFLFVLVMALLYGYLTVRNIVKPVEQLADAARAIQAGDLSQRIPVDGYAELRDLGQAFNDMAAQLQGTLDGLERNVAELQRAQSALQASETKYRGLFENANDIVYTHDLNGDFTSSNDRVLGMLGYPLDEVLQMNIKDIIHPDDVALAQDNIRKKLKREEPDTTYELRVMKKNGNFVVVEVSTRLIYTDDKVVGVQGIARDVTARKQAEDALRQGQKLESIGLLAGGVAHDFNNLLTGMLAQSSLAIRKLAKDAPARQHIEKAVISAERAADLTRQLLAYAGKGQFQIELIDMNLIIQENAGLLETAMPQNTKFVLDLAPDLPMVEADKGQIQQVVMNLVINAAESIEADSGFIKIGSSVCEIDEHQPIEGRLLGAERLANGRYICLQVSDNGVGMDEETMARIFDPFFSTKTSGRGLGLSATLGIIRAHDGGLQVDSAPGEGTSFTVFFPEGKSIMEKPTPLPAERPSLAGKVLVIDDEEPVREAVVDILETVGVETLTAENGREGVAIYREKQQAIALVLVDMQMPIMDGAETLAALYALNPEVKTILSSGYSKMELSDLLGAGSPTMFLQKPYDVAQLIARVQELL